MFLNALLEVHSGRTRDFTSKLCIVNAAFSIISLSIDILGDL